MTTTAPMAEHQLAGLLIRGFGVQEPGGAPVPTWDTTAQDHFYVPDLSGFFVPACSRADA